MEVVAVIAVLGLVALVVWLLTKLFNAMGRTYTNAKNKVNDKISPHKKSLKWALIIGIPLGILLAALIL